MAGQYKLDPKDWSIRDWKNIAWESVHVDGIVCPSPAFVFSLSIHSDGNGEADALVYDGLSLSATNKHIQLYCADERYRHSAYWPPLYFHQGIYVNIGTNVDSVIVQYLPWRD